MLEALPAVEATCPGIVDNVEFKLSDETKIDLRGLTVDDGEF